MHKAEALVQRLFAENYALELKRIPESNVPTPDFNVFKNGKHVAALEVKALADTGEKINVADPKQVARIRTEFAIGTRNENGPNRVAKKLHEAVAQLEGVAVSKIVVFLNQEGRLDRDDLREVLQGFLRYGADRITSLEPATAARLVEDRTKLDIYMWVEASPGEEITITIWPVTDVGRALRQDIFKPQSYRPALV